MITLASEALLAAGCVVAIFIALSRGLGECKKTGTFIYH